MLLVQNIKLKLNDDTSQLQDKIKKVLRLREPFTYTIVRRSIDARDTTDILFVYHVAVDTKEEKRILQKNIKNVQEYTPRTYDIEYKQRNKTVAVVGYGPAGIFASLTLQEAGFDVTVFERGKQVDERQIDVDRFWDESILDPESNVQFGEGGAGTFSDGKLTNRSNNPRNVKLFDEFIQAGAPEDIAYVNNPHVGTDLLKTVIERIRNKFISLGGTIRYQTKVEELWIEEETCLGVVHKEKEAFDYIVLAIGHSARDTFRAIYKQGVEISSKPFAVGFRIEHLQSMINECQFGLQYNNPRLGVAEYKLTHQTKERGVYTFCMSPGGMVVAAQSTPETVVVNGMSYHARSLQNANSAVLVTVDPTDFGPDVFSGVLFQEQVEHQAYLLAGANYFAPVQTVKGYIENKVYPLEEVVPSYPIGTTLTNMRGLYPKAVEEALVEGLENMNKKIPGFAEQGAILTGVETRSSSPIRIVRDKNTLESNIKHLFPIGEGCGYAGGIVSAAVDGIKCYEQILRMQDE